MKLLLALLINLFSFAALAGDLYLVCEDTKQEDLVSVSIEDGQAAMLIMAQETEPVRLKLKRVSSTSLKYELKVTTLKSGQSEKIELAVFEEVTIGNYSCMIRD